MFDRQQYLKERREKAAEFWKLVMRQADAGLSPGKIAEININPTTGRPYTREHIHWILRKTHRN